MKLHFNFLQELRLKFKLVQKTIINQRSFYASPPTLSVGQVPSRGSRALRTCQSNSCSDDSKVYGRTWSDQCMVISCSCGTLSCGTTASTLLSQNASADFLSQAESPLPAFVQAEVIKVVLWWRVNTYLKKKLFFLRHELSDVEYLLQWPE